MNFNNPTEVTIEIKSPVVDFQLGSSWTSEVTLKILPPYENDAGGIVHAIRTAMNDVGLRPLDNMADMEDAWNWAGVIYGEQRDILCKRMARLLESNGQTESKLSVDYVTELLTIKIDVVEREDVFPALDKLDLSPITEAATESERLAALAKPDDSFTVSVIAAMAKGRIIGNGPDIPWHLPEDLEQFKQTTMGHGLIVGRKTLDSIGRLLPGRTTVVLTRDAETRERLRAKYGKELIIKDNMRDAVLFIQRLGLDCDIIGGGAIYSQALEFADRLVLTYIDLDVMGNIKFPVFDLATYQPVDSAEHTSSEGVAYTRAIYKRVPKTIQANG